MPPRSAEPSQPEPDAPPARARILVIDDQPSVARSIGLMLERHHDVVVARDAADALARLTRGERYDLILCDLMMPALAGPDVCRELELVAPGTRGRVVFMTGGVYTEEGQRALDELHRPVLQKPFTFRALQRVLAQVGAAEPGPGG